MFYGWRRQLWILFKSSFNSFSCKFLFSWCKLWTLWSVLRSGKCRTVSVQFHPNLNTSDLLVFYKISFWSTVYSKRWTTQDTFTYWWLRLACWPNHVISLLSPSHTDWTAIRGDSELGNLPRHAARTAASKHVVTSAVSRSCKRSFSRTLTPWHLAHFIQSGLRTT